MTMQEVNEQRLLDSLNAIVAIAPFRYSDVFNAVRVADDAGTKLLALEAKNPDVMIREDEEGVCISGLALLNTAMMHLTGGKVLCCTMNDLGFIAKFELVAPQSVTPN